MLGLALTAFTANVSGYLRQGCNLVIDASKAQPRKTEEVHPSGERRPFVLSHHDALAYAEEAAHAHGVGKSREVEFDRERASERRCLVTLLRGAKTAQSGAHPPLTRGKRTTTLRTATVRERSALEIAVAMDHHDAPLPYGRGTHSCFSIA